MRDIHETLELWGAWAASDNSGVDFSPIAAGFKGLLPQTSKSRSQCSDDVGIMIDGCVARLKKYRMEEYELVILHYVYAVSLRAIAKRRKCSDGTIRKDMQTAQGFVLGCMAMGTMLL
ncbi:antitermination protein [Rahnella sp. PD12R]|uniref:antiterminator Q family protein n=1 Tax=Rahnella sp. PD12R TaxID=2855688 RepID=UPI001C4722A4|nr:antiterminator Q family protein [Rahnella sp. PD12R]MBV6817767.1 antitermination protein [Rahnella sp. PD12R]